MKLILRTILFLLTLFVVIYTAMSNTQTITFNFPILLDKPIQAEAPLIFFAIFSIGVIGGTMLNAGGGSKGKGSSSSDSKRK